MADETSAQVVPNIFVDSVETERSFYMERLGFDHMMGIVGKDGKLDFAMVRRDGAMIMLARPEENMEGTAERFPTKRPLAIYISVRDVDAYHDELQKKGVRILEPVKTQWWGDRNFAVQDPYGYRLWFYQTVQAWEKVSPPPGVKVV